ncbi:MAG: serine protease, partial [Bacteroidota bacterium]
MKRSLFLLLFLLSGVVSFAQTDLTALIDKCSPSIFKITTYDASGNEYAVGTGFFISATGTALSNYHVFQGASKAKIKTSDNKTYLVENIIGWSKESDLLKFTVKNELNETFPYLKMNAVSPKQGEKIFIIGNPLGLEKSVADGIVSSVRQDDKMGETIQITAPISHGNSGSPLM